MEQKEDTYLGFEMSTTTLRAVLLNRKFEFLTQTEVNFDTDLSEFKTDGGFNTASNNAYYYVRPIMIVKAVDMILDKLIEQHVKLNFVKCISGSVQQHCYVLWTKQGIELLKNTVRNKTLSEQLNNAFVMDSLIWSNNIVEQQCEAIETAVGGKDEIWRITGTKCYPQFSAPQIKKLYEMRQNLYERSDKISVFSSFIASLFIGNMAPVEYSDASNMNLFDIINKNWSTICLQACAPNLEKKLDTVTEPCTIIGTVSNYLQEKYGFTSHCKVVAFTGHVSSIFTGFLVGDDWVVLTFGERDTIMMNIDTIPDPPQLNTQVMCHPTSSRKYLGIVSFKNGDLARNYIMKTEANNSWDKFIESLDKTDPGNNGYMAMHLPTPEIKQRAKSILRWSQKHNKHDNESKKGLKRFNSSDIEIRAFIEGQMLHRRLLTENMGFNFTDDTRILVTGVRPDSKPLIKVVADVFNAPVYMMDTNNSTLFGNIFRSKYSLLSYYAKQKDIPEDIGDFEKFTLRYLESVKLHVCDPRENSSSIYAPMLERSRDMLEILQDRRMTVDTEF